MSTTKNRNVIIINNAYTGSYGQNQNNLPHEMINFFKADEELGYYVYITPTGTINNKIAKEDIKGILFIRSVGNGMVEVLGKAELGDNSEFYTEGIGLNKDNKISSVHGKKANDIVSAKEEYLSEINQSIFYGTKSLEYIHETNSSDNGILVSMKVDKICLPKKTFYLTYKSENQELLNNVYFLPANDGKSDGKKIANESMLAYYFEKDNKNAYDILKNKVLDGDLWKSEKETRKYNSQDIDDIIMGNNNFFKITRQQDNEVMFSNMLYYYFSNYSEILNHFTKECLKIDNLTENCVVEREKERMDIRIIDDNNYIIIENKIKSGINGIKKKSNKTDEDDANTEKKTKYNYDKITGLAIDKDGRYLSQLSDYLEKAEKANGNRKISAFIFAPNYSPLNKKLLNDKYSRGNEYEIKHYSEIKNAFEKYTGERPPYFQDFLDALNKHTKLIDDEHRLNLLYRLKCRIDNIK